MIVAGACLGTMGCLFGAEFYSISSIQSSTSATDFYPVGNLIEGQGIGFGANEPHNSTDGSSFNYWVTDACDYPCDYYLTQPAPVLTIDLGEDRALNEISIWTYFVDNSGKNFSLRFASQQDGPGGYGTSITFSPTFVSPVVDLIPRQSFAFQRTVVARYVEVTINDNFFQGTGIAGGDRVGLGEIAFAVPNENKERLLVTAPRDFQARSGEAQLSSLGAVPFTYLGNPIAENYWSAALDSTSGDVYFSVPTEGRIYRGNLNDDPPVLELFKESAGAVFHGMAVDEVNGNLFVLDSGDDVIRIYQMATGSNFGTVGGGVTLQRPNELVFDRQRQWLIVSDSGLDTIQIYSPSSQGLLYELDHASTEGVWGLAIDPETGEVIYSSHDRGEVWRWDPPAASALPILMHQGLSGPRGLGYDRQGRLFCVESGTGQVRTLGEQPELFYSSAAGGRDLILFADCDFNGNYLPDDWEVAQTDPFLARGLSFASNFDGDAFSDGLEAALGGDFMSPSDGNGFDFTVGAAGTIEVAHLALKKSDFRYQLFHSDDLLNWQAFSALPQVASGGSLYDTWTFQIDLSEEGIANEEEIFVRVGVEIEN